MIRAALTTSRAVERGHAAAVRPSRDWAGVREGVREVFLTLAATLAIGFAWAAIETGRIAAEPGPAGASALENRYAGEPRPGQ